MTRFTPILAGFALALGLAAPAQAHGPFGHGGEGAVWAPALLGHPPAGLASPPGAGAPIAPAPAALPAAVAAAPRPRGPKRTRAYRGTLVVRHSDTFSRRGSTTRYALRQGRRTRTIRPEAAPPRVASGAKVVVRGRRAGTVIRGRIAKAGPLARTAAAPLGPRKTAVILVNFSDDTSQPWTPAHVRQRIFTDADSTNAFYREQSYGQAEFVGRDRPDGDVLGWHTIAASGSTCAYNTWASQARSAVEAAGGSLAGYDHVVYLFPGQNSCGWAGLAELPGDQSWINGELTVRVTAHELGHNLGIHHAASLRCDDNGLAVALSDTCTTDEYGDRFDVMGSSGSRHSNAWHLQQLGYLPASNVQTVTTSGTYTVRSAISQHASVQSLRIPRRRTAFGTVEDYLYLEFRTPGGVFDNFALTDPVVNGVSVRLNREPNVVTQSKLIDTNPGTVSVNDAALGVGQTFSDGEVIVTTTGISGLTATVNVTVGANDTQAPTTPTGVRAEPVAGGVQVSWNPASDDVGVTGYRVTRDGISRGTTPATSFRDSSASPGITYAYRVVAYDAAGNASESAPVTAAADPPPDVTAPTPPRNLRGALAGGLLRLAWDPSFDDRAVAGYVVIRDGLDLGTVGGTAYDDSPATGAEHEYRVKAIDATGNRSAASAAFRFAGDLDARAPSVSIRRPAHRSRVTGVVPVLGRATDDVGVRSVELWIDGKRRRTAKGGTVRLDWDTRRLRRGTHKVQIRALDTSGNRSVRSVSVTVARARR